MPNLLISGSAGSGKSAAAREELAASNEPAIIAEIQPLYAALLGIERGPDGRYPERRESDAHALRLAEYLRRAAITASVARGIRVITTNSDSDLDRRAFLLNELGPGATLNESLPLITTLPYPTSRGRTAQRRTNAAGPWNAGIRGADVDQLLCELRFEDETRESRRGV